MSFDFGDMFSGVGDALSSGISNLGGDISSWFGGGNGMSFLNGIDTGSVNFDASQLGNGGLFDAGSAASGIGSALGGLAGGLGSGLSGMNLTGGVDPNSVNFNGNGQTFGNGTPGSAGGASTPNLTGAAGGAAKLLTGNGGGATNVQQPASGGTVQQQPGGGATNTNNNGGSGILGGLGGLLSSAGNFATQNPALVLGGLMPLLSNLFKPSLPPQATQLQTQAQNQLDLVNNQLMPTAIANQQGMINGQALDTIGQSSQRQEAAMRKAYADMGMSGSTMEAQDLNNIRENAASQVFATGQQMASTGLTTAANLSNQAGGWLQEVMNAQVQQDKDLEDAISQIAAAAVKPSSSTTVNNNTGGGAAGGNSAVSGLLSGLLPAGLDPSSADFNAINQLGTDLFGTGAASGGLNTLLNSVGLGQPTPTSGGVPSVGGIDLTNVNFDANGGNFGSGGYSLLSPDIQALLAQTQA